MILSENSTQVDTIDDNTESVIFHLISAYEILKNQMSLLDRVSEYLWDFSLKGQAQHSIVNALELLAVHNKQRMSYTNRNLPPSRKKMEAFLKKWKDRHSTSS